MKDFEQLRKQIEKSIKGFSEALEAGAFSPRPKNDEDDDK